MCGACEREKASTMVQMYGQPYNQNTLKPVPPGETASLHRVRINEISLKLFYHKFILFIISKCYTKQNFSFFTLKQNFSVCKKCSRLAALFHRLHHQKHRMYTKCVEVVEGRKKAVPNLDTTKILNELLANEQWLEQVNFRL